MQDTDEIDLLEFFQTIWDGKFKIACVIVMAVLGVVGFSIPNRHPLSLQKLK
jgi:LPS O-antigen subunit length determinant protein (WzzB/FepE family)